MADSFLNIKLSTKGKLFNVNGNNITIGKTLESRLGDKGMLKRDTVEIAGMIRDKIEANIISKGLVDTGKLVNSVIVDSKGSDVVVRMAKSKYKSGVEVGQVAKWLNDGTKRHFIKPKKAGGVLAWNAGGKTLFSKGHFVSGIKPQKFFEISKKDLTAFTKTVITDRLFSKGGFSNLQNRKAS